MLDSLHRAYELTVAGGDFYDSGRAQTGPRTVLVDHSWDLVATPDSETRLRQSRRAAGAVASRSADV